MAASAKVQQFKVAASDRKEFKFSFEGDDRVYVATQPKTAQLGNVWIAADSEKASGNISAIYDFFGGPKEDGKRTGGVLSAEDWAHIEHRLNDRLDGLDVDHLTEVFKVVVTELVGVPNS